MESMNALVIGESEELGFAQLPVPEPDAGELLVRIRAIGVGIHDSYFLPQELSLPYPIGIEAAGVVEQVGADVTGVRSGDRIAFVSMMNPKGGVWADYATVRADSLILPLPEAMPFEQAAAIPVAVSTTLRALHGLGSMPSGAALFVAGGSGAIGTVALQLAVRRGWRVAASASAANHDYLLDLGAELAVDYRNPRWQDQVRAWCPGGVDGALAVQPDTTAASMSLVRPGGAVVTISGDRVQPEGNVVVNGLSYGADIYPDLLAFLDDVLAGRMRVVIEREYPFEQAVEALRKVSTRHARGKLVLTLD